MFELKDLKKTCNRPQYYYNLIVKHAQGIVLMKKTIRDIYDYPSLKTLMKDVRESYTLMELAKPVGVSHQTITLIFNGSEHRVLNRLQGWKKALKLNKQEGDYFEFLAILAAYPKERDKMRLLMRAFHLAERLEAALNQNCDIANSLVYWLDPLCPFLRNAVEMNGFPRREREIAPWVADVMTLPESAKITRPALIKRIETTWNWLFKIGAIEYSPSYGRWIKSSPMLISAGKFAPELKDIQSALFSMVFVTIFHRFIETIHDENIIVTKFGTFALSSANAKALNQICSDFVIETVRKLNYASNDDDLARLKTENKKYYDEVVNYKAELERKGIKLEPKGDKDVDTVVQLAVAARMMTKNR